MKPRAFSLVEVILSLALLVITLVTINQHITITLKVSAHSMSRFGCIVAANNLLEMGMASTTPLLTGLRALLDRSGALTPLDQEKVLPSALQPGGNIGNVLGKLKRESATVKSVATDVAAIYIRDAMTGDEIRLQAYRYPLE